MNTNPSRPQAAASSSAVPTSTPAAEAASRTPRERATMLPAVDVVGAFCS